MKNMKFNLRPKFVIYALVSLLTLAALSCAMAKNAKQKEENHSEIFFSNDIFSEMEMMEKDMNRAFAEHQKLMNKMFEDMRSEQKRLAKSTSKSAEGSSLSAYQDEKFYRYELAFSSFKAEDVVVSVEGKILTLSATKKESFSKNKANSFKANSNFYYSLAIPSDAAANPEVKREKNKITVIFAKIAKEEK